MRRVRKRSSTIVHHLSEPDTQPSVAAVSPISPFSPGAQPVEGGRPVDHQMGTPVILPLGQQPLTFRGPVNDGRDRGGPVGGCITWSGSMRLTRRPSEPLATSRGANGSSMCFDDVERENGVKLGRHLPVNIVDGGFDRPPRRGTSPHKQHPPKNPETKAPKTGQKKTRNPPQNPPSLQPHRHSLSRVVESARPSFSRPHSWQTVASNPQPYGDPCGRRDAARSASPQICAFRSCHRKAVRSYMSCLLVR